MFLINSMYIFLVALLVIFDQTEAKPAEKVSCLKICTDDYTPVCGEDASGNRKTFPNACGMDAENCDKADSEKYALVKNGEC